MFRIANVVMVGALLVTAAVVYQLKYASTAEAERLATLRAQIRKEREIIAVLKAEWARRTSPVFVQGLVERHLDLKRLDVDSMSGLDDLPEKPSNNDDGIGGIIEALVDAPLGTAGTAKPAAVPGATPVPAGGGSGPVVPSSSALRPAGQASPKPAPATTSSVTRQAPRPAAAPAQPSPQMWTPPAASPSASADPLAPMLPPGSLPR